METAGYNFGLKKILIIIAFWIGKIVLTLVKKR